MRAAPGHRLLPYDAERRPARLRPLVSWRAVRWMLVIMFLAGLAIGWHARTILELVRVSP
jgi:hypothetical protein